MASAQLLCGRAYAVDLTTGESRWVDQIEEMIEEVEEEGDDDDEDP